MQAPARQTELLKENDPEGVVFEDGVEA